jgi:hypothetical protein
MAYTTIPTFTDVPATAANLNTYSRDNQRAIKDPPSANYEANEGADYSTSSTTYGNVDPIGTDFTLQITTTGGDVVISAILHCNGNAGYFDVSVDGTRIANNNSGGLCRILPNAGNLGMFTRIITGLSAASHTFILMWRADSAGSPVILYAGAGTANRDVHPQFWVRELS